VTQNESLDQQNTEKAMLVQDKLQETNETTTEETPVDGLSTPAGPPAKDVLSATRSPRSRRRSIWLPAATAALVGVATLVAVAQSDQDATDPGSALDGSFELAEASRMEALRGTTSVSVSDGSFEVAEANRMEALRDMTSGSVSDGSFDVAEANRMEALRDMTSGSVSDGSFDVAEANRMEALRDAATGS
jgi:hypothetical protein